MVRSEREHADCSKHIEQVQICFIRGMKASKRNDRNKKGNKGDQKEKN
jgi:hypothetical protein